MSATLSQLPTVDAPKTRARILIVDDVHGNLVATEAVLEPLGHELVLAGSGKEALKHLLHDEFACIVMDVQMPGLDGMETARLIRQRERTRHIPILFVTALSREMAWVMRGYAEGAVDYLLKPIEPEILRTKVSVFVELYLRGEQLKAQALEIAGQRRAQEELRRATELEQQLVGIVGHDLRTPINAILLTAQQQLKDANLEARHRTAFERVARGADRITEIVELLLDFTRERLGGGIPVVHKQSDLATGVRAVLDELRTTHPDRQITLQAPELPVTGHWDLARLKQVVSNLVDNALKYSPPQSPVAVVLEDGPEEVRLRVHNEGPPIPAEQLPVLFEPFRRGREGDDQARVSLGLGLFIACAIAKAHGGELTVHSEADHGTEFTLRVPKAETAGGRSGETNPDQLSA